jgi:hypothetical protein
MRYAIGLWAAGVGNARTLAAMAMSTKRIYLKAHQRRNLI